MSEQRCAGDIVVECVQAQHGMQPFSQLPRNADPSTVGGVRSDCLHQGSHPAITGVHAEIPVVHAGIAIKGAPGIVPGCE
jgi:hypothetical protein